MERQSKVWGDRWLLRQDSVHSLSYLELKAGDRCSWHLHEQKYNLFFVIQGRIGVVTHEIDGSKKETVLTPGQFLTVPPGQCHEFRVYEDSKVIEEMYVQYTESDIERYEKGGALVCN